MCPSPAVSMMLHSSSFSRAHWRHALLTAEARERRQPYERNSKTNERWSLDVENMSVAALGGSSETVRDLRDSPLVRGVRRLLGGMVLEARDRELFSPLKPLAPKRALNVARIDLLLF